MRDSEFFAFNFLRWEKRCRVALTERSPRPHHGRPDVLAESPIMETWKLSSPVRAIRERERLPKKQPMRRQWRNGIHQVRAARAGRFIEVPNGPGILTQSKRR